MEIVCVCVCVCVWGGGGGGGGGLSVSSQTEGDMDQIWDPWVQGKCLSATQQQVLPGK